MIYGLLGDITIFLHLLWVLFILLGVLLAGRHRLLLQVHLAGLIFTIVINVGGWFCPLTYLENYLYGLYDPKLAYAGSFISQYMQKLIYMSLDEFTLRIGAILWATANLAGYIIYFWKKKSFAMQSGR